MKIFDDNFMLPIFEILERTRGVEQHPIHHPEGCVLTHSLQVFEIAIRESHDTDLVLAALLHDVGKIEKSHGHEKIAIEWLSELVSPKTLWLIEHHMRVWAYLKGEMKRHGKCVELVEHPWIVHLIQLARWDKSGRNPNKVMVFEPQEIMEKLNLKSLLHFKVSHEV